MGCDQTNVKSALPKGTKEASDLTEILVVKLMGKNHSDDDRNKVGNIYPEEPLGKIGYITGRT
jgi:hypothetical protein